jgi:hypothetical protein
LSHSFPEAVAKPGKWPTLLADDPQWTAVEPDTGDERLDAEQRGEPWTA